MTTITITLIRFRLRATAPFSIGASNGSGEVDLPIAVDPDGHPFVPAASVAGSLRSHLRLQGMDEQLMGARKDDDDGTREVEAGTAGEAQPGPSVLRILGTTLGVPHGDHPVPVAEGGTDQIVGQLQRTAIDRRRGAAATNKLYRSQHVDAGVEVEVYARADRVITDDELRALTTWRPVLGRGRTSGFGACDLVGLWWGVLDLDRTEDLLRWISGGGPDLHRAVATTAVELLPGRGHNPVLDLRFEIADGIAVGGGAGNETTDRPILRDPDGVPVVEGSSLKGVLRARSAFILRSLGVEVCDTSTCGECPTCHVFGSVEARGRVAVDRTRVDGAGTVIRTHVALDRFTGGGRDKHLFDNEEVNRGVITLRVRELAPLPSWAEPLLRWCARDLADGMIGIGGMTSRGLGTLRLADGEPEIGAPPLTTFDFSERGA